MSGVAASAKETIALGGFGNAVGHRQGITDQLAIEFIHSMRQALLHLPQRTDEGCRITPIETQGIKAATAQVPTKPFQALQRAQLGTLLDTPAVGDHHR